MGNLLGVRHDLLTYRAQQLGDLSFHSPISILRIVRIQAADSGRIAMKPLAELFCAETAPFSREINQDRSRPGPSSLAAGSNEDLRGRAMLVGYRFDQRDKADSRTSRQDLGPLGPLLHPLDKIFVAQKSLIDRIIVALPMPIPTPAAINAR